MQIKDIRHTSSLFDNSSKYEAPPICGNITLIHDGERNKNCKLHFTIWYQITIDWYGPLISDTISSKIGQNTDCERKHMLFAIMTAEKWEALIHNIAHKWRMGTPTQFSYKEFERWIIDLWCNVLCTAVIWYPDISAALSLSNKRVSIASAGKWMIIMIVWPLKFSTIFPSSAIWPYSSRHTRICVY